MLYIALTQLLIIAALVYGLIVREREHDKAIQWLVNEHSETEQKLITRVQRPELVPTQSRPSQPTREAPDLSALRKIGTIAPTREPDAS